MWFAAQARNHNTIWVGKFADAGNGKGCLVKKAEARSESAPLGMGLRRSVSFGARPQAAQTEVIDGTTFGRGDSILTVEWWDLDPSDPEHRTYKKWTPPAGGPTQFVLNSTELRDINFTMTPVNPVAPPLEDVRRSGRTGVVAARAQRERVEAQREDAAYNMPAEVENEILRRCW